MAEKLQESIYMSKLAEQTERWEDMVNFMKKVIESNHEIKEEERNLLQIAYKNNIGQRRTAWRAISAYELKEKAKGSQQLEVIRYYKQKIEKELQIVCTEILELVEKFLKAEKNVESRVFFLKMKGDYNRYLAEFTIGENQKAISEQTQKAYTDAMENAEELKTTHQIRLGLALNFSVFYYEIMNDLTMACKTAKKAFDDAIDALDGLEEDQYKDTTTILQLIRDNLTQWTNELTEQNEKK